MQSNPVRWFEIYVQDMALARNFYESVFKVNLQKLDTPDLEIWAFPMSMDEAGASGALVKMDGCPSGGNSTIIYFACNDCAVEALRVVEYGGRIHKEKMSIGQYGFIALAYDPDGNIFGMHSVR